MRWDQEEFQVHEDAHQVDQLLSDTGDDWRKAGLSKPLSQRSMDRMARSVLAAARTEEETQRSQGVRESILAWLRKLSHPLGYGFAGAMAVFAWFILSPPNKSQTIAHVLYSSETAQTTQSPSPEMSSNAVPLKKGAEFIVAQAPGALFEVGKNVHLLAREGASLRFLSDNHLSVQEGEVWVYAAQSEEDLQIDTPKGRVSANGTVFGVSATQDEDAEQTLEAQVLGGKIQVASAGNSTRVRAGQRLRLDDETSAQESSPVDAPVHIPPWALQVQKAYAHTLYGRYFPSVTPQSNAQGPSLDN